jgi:hypothetical protein
MYSMSNPNKIYAFYPNLSIKYVKDNNPYNVIITYNYNIGHNIPIATKYITLRSINLKTFCITIKKIKSI